MQTNRNLSEKLACFIFKFNISDSSQVHDEYETINFNQNVLFNSSEQTYGTYYPNVIRSESFETYESTSIQSLFLFRRDIPTSKKFNISNV